MTFFRIAAVLLLASGCSESGPLDTQPPLSSPPLPALTIEPPLGIVLPGQSIGFRLLSGGSVIPSGQIRWSTRNPGIGAIDGGGNYSVEVCPRTGYGSNFVRGELVVDRSRHADAEVIVVVVADPLVSINGIIEVKDGKPVDLDRIPATVDVFINVAAPLCDEETAVELLAVSEDLPPVVVGTHYLDKGISVPRIVSIRWYTDAVSAGTRVTPPGSYGLRAVLSPHSSNTIPLRLP